jgi:hypothetical protein
MNFYRIQFEAEGTFHHYDTLSKVMSECRDTRKDERDNVRVQLVDISTAKDNVLRMLNGQPVEGVTVLKRWRLANTARSVELVELKADEE